MDKKIKYVLWSFLAIILVIVILNSFIIGNSKSGIVLDSITKEPLENVVLVRSTYIIKSSFHGSSENLIRSEITTTDSEGYFEFSQFLRLQVPWQNNYRELLSVNGDASLFGGEGLQDSRYISNYHTETLGLGFSDGFLLEDRKPYRQGTHTYIPFNNKMVIYLSPIVSNISACENDEVCIEKTTALQDNCITTPWPEPGSDIRCKDFPGK